MEQKIIQLIEEGCSLKKIQKEYSVSRRFLENLVKKHNLELKYKKLTYVEDFFTSINTKEKAYILGFLLGDGCLTNDNLELSIALQDEEILDYIVSNIGGQYHTYTETNVKQKRFPRVRLSTSNKKILNDLHRLFGGFKKEDRHIPIIRKELDKYLLLGFFDAEGCITWGYRKDRDRLWHKISFTSSLSMLSGIQKILLNNGISTKLYPKTNENCFVLEFANRKDILNFYNIIYTDLVVLKRKNNKYDALRLELGELLGSSDELSAAEPTE
jgi:hypothetical protein